MLDDATRARILEKLASVRIALLRRQRGVLKERAAGRFAGAKPSAATPGPGERTLTRSDRIKAPAKQLSGPPALRKPSSKSGARRSGAYLSSPYAV